jgi:O-antigen/teichoic acid export membrane protein
MAAEPFFFKKSVDANAKEVYARLMKVFVIACCFIFLFITLFIDVWEIVLTLKSKAYAEAISIVPILSLGSVFLGIYYNQSVWYKLSDQNKFGAYITLGGALITILANVILIPLYKYNGAAWANLLCYVFMMLTSYFLGQKYYPIQYPLKRILTYLFCILTMYLLHQLFSVYVADVYLRIGAGSLLFGSFILIVIRLDGNEFASLPMIGKYFVKR